MVQPDDAEGQRDVRGSDDPRAVRGESSRRTRFLGTHHPRLDDKGRLFLPAKFRDRLAGGLVITPGQEHCLYVFPEPEFDRIFDRIRQAPVTSKAARDYQRMFMAKASDETPDKQGRVTVNAELRAYAGLTKECVVIGAGTRVEVWDEGSWARYSAEQEGPFADLSEEVLPGLI